MLQFMFITLLCTILFLSIYAVWYVFVRMVAVLVTCLVLGLIVGSFAVVVLH